MSQAIAVSVLVVACGGGSTVDPPLSGSTPLPAMAQSPHLVTQAGWLIGPRGGLSEMVGPSAGSDAPAPLAVISPQQHSSAASTSDTGRSAGILGILIVVGSLLASRRGREISR